MQNELYFQECNGQRCRGLMAHGAMAFETDPQPDLLDVIAPNRIAAFIANTGIAALRSQMEIQYDYLSTDVM